VRCCLTTLIAILAPSLASAECADVRYGTRVPLHSFTCEVVEQRMGVRAPKAHRRAEAGTDARSCGFEQGNQSGTENAACERDGPIAMIVVCPRHRRRLLAYAAVQRCLPPRLDRARAVVDHRALPSRRARADGSDQESGRDFSTRRSSLWWAASARVGHHWAIPHGRADAHAPSPALRGRARSGERSRRQAAQSRAASVSLEGSFSRRDASGLGSWLRISIPSSTMTCSLS
jgi:hypothetical protein